MRHAKRERERERERENKECLLMNIFCTQQLVLFAAELFVSMPNSCPCNDRHNIWELADPGRPHRDCPVDLGHSAGHGGNGMRRDTQQEQRQKSIPQP